MNYYGYTQIKIENLEEIQKKENNFYNFKGINFLSKMNPQNTKIVFLFHGASPQNVKQKVIFRGYDYDIKNTDIICISDYLLTIYDNYTINWTLPTKKHNVEFVYKEIIGYFLNKKYEKIIMTGTSAGGYPSIKFACYFNATALVSNSQIYIEKYRGMNTLNKMLESHDDFLIYEEKEIEKIIQANKPQKIIIYNNKSDSTYKLDILPLLSFIEKNNLISYFEINLFDYNGIIPEGKSHHHIQFPDNKKHIEILKKYLFI